MNITKSKYNDIVNLKTEPFNPNEIKLLKDFCLKNKGRLFEIRLPKAADQRSLVPGFVFDEPSSYIGINLETKVYSMYINYYIYITKNEDEYFIIRINLNGFSSTKTSEYYRIDQYDGLKVFINHLDELYNNKKPLI